MSDHVLHKKEVDESATAASLRNAQIQGPREGLAAGLTEPPAQELSSTNFKFEVSRKKQSAHRVDTSGLGRSEDRVACFRVDTTPSSLSATVQTSSDTQVRDGDSAIRSSSADRKNTLLKALGGRAPEPSCKFTVLDKVMRWFAELIKALDRRLFSRRDALDGLSPPLLRPKKSADRLLRQAKADEGAIQETIATESDETETTAVILDGPVISSGDGNGKS